MRAGFGICKLLSTKVTAWLPVTTSNNQEVSHHGLPLLTTLISKSSAHTSDWKKTKLSNHVKSYISHKIWLFLTSYPQTWLSKGLLHFLPLGTKRQASLLFHYGTSLRAQSASSWKTTGLPIYISVFCYTLKSGKLHTAVCASITMPLCLIFLY